MHLYRARQHPEAFLEAVTVRRRPATRWNEHVEHREAAVGLLPREQHGVGVADNREVDERLVVGTHDRELALRIISGWERRGSSCRVVHVFLPVGRSVPTHWPLVPASSMSVRIRGLPVA